MHAITISNISDEAFEKLSRLAIQHSKSLEEEAGDLLRKGLSATLTPKEKLAIVERIAAMTPKGVAQTDSVELLREDRDR